MALELYLAFVLATTVLIAVPGPNVSLIVANSLAYGSRYGLVTVAGTGAAQILQLAVTTLGMTSVMVFLAQWFEWLRWAGVAYLLWLGLRYWRLPANGPAPGAERRIGLRPLFWRGFLVAATNPKVLLFYAAFFPQFIDPAAPAGPQLVLLSATFFTIAIALDSGYAICAGRLHGWLGDRRRARLRNRAVGGLIIGAAAGLALARRS
ncbi:MAG: LysE family translocator [Kiloniellales bacterium]|nr:LysE family translocator [Kiloniellales bacterium]